MPSMQVRSCVRKCELFPSGELDWEKVRLRMLPVEHVVAEYVSGTTGLLKGVMGCFR
jgi:hypothetical protein